MIATVLSSQLNYFSHVSFLSQNVIINDCKYTYSKGKKNYERFLDEGDLLKAAAIKKSIAGQCQNIMSNPDYMHSFTEPGQAQKASNHKNINFKNYRSKSFDLNA